MQGKNLLYLKTVWNILYGLQIFDILIVLYPVDLINNQYTPGTMRLCIFFFSRISFTHDFTNDYNCYISVF